jgi:hypothetical protein
VEPKTICNVLVKEIFREKEHQMAKKSSGRKASTAASGRSRRPTASSTANSLYGDVLGIAGSLFRNRQQAGAERINAVAGAARNFAADLDDIPNVQTYANSAADQMELLSDYLSETRMDDIVEDAMDVAKRHPVSTAVFAVAVGFAFTRLMTHRNTASPSGKSTARKRSAKRAAAKPVATRKRASTKAKVNGRDMPTARAHAA